MPTTRTVAYLTVSLLAATVAGAQSSARQQALPSELEATYVAVFPETGACYLTLPAPKTYSLQCGPVSSRGSLGVFNGRIKLFDVNIPGLWIRSPPGRGNERTPTDPTPPLVARDRPYPPPTLLSPVRWGQRIYLLGPTDNEAFCRDVASGAEPRAKAKGEYFVRVDDLERAVAPQKPSLCANVAK